MLISSKKQSDDIIKKLDLNRIDGKTFTANEITEAEKYIKTSPYPLFGIRDRKTAMGTFHHGVTPEDAMQKIKGYEVFTVCESLIAADKNHLLLQGEIEVKKNLDVIASLNDEAGTSNRDAMKNPKYKISFNDAMESTPKIIGFNTVLNYIYTHELFDCVVEFGYYDIPVGVKRENIIIWELRNY